MKEIRYWTSHPCSQPAYWLHNLALNEDDFHLVYDAVSPDYLIATEHIYFERLAKLDFQRLYSSRRVTIFWAGEAISPDLNIFDYVMTFDKGLSLSDRIVRRPMLSIFASFKHDPLNVGCAHPQEELSSKTGFCNFIYSNPFAHPRRDWLFYMLAKYKHIDALGPHLHNCSLPTSRGADNFDELSVEMKRPYKFSIAAENASFFGYTSEKLITSFCAHTIPIYWGNPDVASEFNPNAFINANDMDESTLVTNVRKVDQDDSLWLQMVSEPPVTAEVFERVQNDETHYRNFMRETFMRPLGKAHRRPEGFWPDNYRRTLFGAAARQVTRRNRLLKLLGRETRFCRWLLRKIRTVEQNRSVREN